MARQVHNRDISATVGAAADWINHCLIEDGSMFAKDLWKPAVASEVQRAFDDHPDYGDDDFMTKLRGQMKSASPAAQKLMAEMLWALLLFPSNMKARTKRKQIRDIWSLSGEQLAETNSYLSDQVLTGIGSGGPGFNNYRPDEMSFLIAISVDLKGRNQDDTFLMASPNAYNSLGVGTTQLYDKTVVYNHKRHGDFQLGNRKFAFRVKPRFPKSLTQEFLLVDLVNNVDQLAEAKDEILKRVAERTASSDRRRLRRAVRDYGNERTKKFFERTLRANELHAA